MTLLTLSGNEMPAPLRCRHPQLVERIIGTCIRQVDNEEDYITFSCKWRSNTYVSFRDADDAEFARMLSGAVIQRMLPGIYNLAGVAESGLPILGGIMVQCFVHDWRRYWVRKAEKDYGTASRPAGQPGSRVVGRPVKGAKLILFEDMITTGSATLDAIDEFAAVGMEVVQVIAAAQHEFFEGRARIEARGIRCDILNNMQGFQLPKPLRYLPPLAA